jgi:hypothetical protein
MEEPANPSMEIVVINVYVPLVLQVHNAKHVRKLHYILKVYACSEFITTKFMRILF